MVCAMTAAGPSWEIHAVQPVLAAALADFAELTHGGLPSNPIAAMAEPMLVLGERDPERAFAVFDRYMTSADPWVRAAVPMMRCSFGRMLGRIDEAESDCRVSLAAFRALGDSWGAASVLIQLAELAQLRGDYPTTIAALTGRRQRSARSWARGVTCPTSTGCSPRSGSGWATWTGPGPTWSRPSASNPSAAHASTTRGPGWPRCAPNCSGNRAI